MIQKLICCHVAPATRHLQALEGGEVDMVEQVLSHPVLA
jgi:hypothetical protein